jgi:hypothetical protein
MGPDAAVFNSAVWCDAVARALGCDTEFRDGLWVNHSPSPPFYPNAATLTRDGSDTQLHGIRLLTDEELGAGWGVKDSYCTLKLAALGFDIALEAEWLGLPAGRIVFDTDAPHVEWQAVRSEAQLAAWEAAWRADSRPTFADEFDSPRIFMPALLDDPDIVLLAAYRREQVVGAVAASRSDDGSGPVVGVSNLVLPPGDERERSGAMAAVRAAFPDVPIVSYDSGADLDAMKALGFESLGPLRVWVHSRT